MKNVFGLTALALGTALLTACGGSQPSVTDSAPLSFVPADTPYAYANLEPTPKAVLDQSSRQMQTVWPAVISMYDKMLQRAGTTTRETKIAGAVLDELRTRDSLDKLREIGFKPDGLAALYGVGIVPVLRLELGDVAAFRAMVARIETKVGEKIPTGKIGAQEFWQVGIDKVSAIVAIENSQLVATVWPNAVDDATKEMLLGLKKPARTLAQSGTLQALAKDYHFAPYGLGFFDNVALATRLLNAPTGTDLAAAQALGVPLDGEKDPVCKSEILDIARRFPRLVAGVESLAVGTAKIGMQVEIESGLASRLMAALTAAPGTAAPAQGIMDISVALPILKLKDFWLAQAEAAVAKPYACAKLSGLNDMFSQSRTKLDMTIPPPFSDMTGFRFSVTKIEPRGAGMPDVAGKILLGTTNPLATIGMAQLALPALKDVKITTDGKVVALPTGMAPLALPPLSIAVSDKAIAVSAGADEGASLAEFLNAPAAPTPVFLRSNVTGAIYAVMAHYAQFVNAKLPAAQRDAFDEQMAMFALNEKLLRKIEFTAEANARGIAIHETVETN